MWQNVRHSKQTCTQAPLNDLVSKADNVCSIKYFGVHVDRWIIWRNLPGHDVCRLAVILASKT